MKGLPRIAITMGDPAGIGPEVIVKALSDEKLNQSARFIIFHGTWDRGHGRLEPANWQAGQFRCRL
jgi:4-hydroxy-L-threonine phosphate dehydrogenase PdxA